MSQQQGSKGNVVFRRIRGRIVPVRLKDGVQRERRAAQGIVGAGMRTGALGAIAGLAATGLGGLYAAGRFERKSQALFKHASVLDTVTDSSGRPLSWANSKSTAKIAGRFNRAAKLTKFASKYGVGALIGTQLASIDRGTSADEGARFANMGAAGGQGGRFDPAKFAVLAAGAYGYMRFGKRFEKWGLRGGRFPWKLRDI